MTSVEAQPHAERLAEQAARGVASDPDWVALMLCERDEDSAWVQIARGNDWGGQEWLWLSVAEPYGSPWTTAQKDYLRAEGFATTNAPDLTGVAHANFPDERTLSVEPSSSGPTRLPSQEDLRPAMERLLGVLREVYQVTDLDGLHVVCV